VAVSLRSQSEGCGRLTQIPLATQIILNYQPLIATPAREGEAEMTKLITAFSRGRVAPWGIRA
jgi:hypothetical protein